MTDNDKVEAVIDALGCKFYVGQRFKVKHKDSPWIAVVQRVHGNYLILQAEDEPGNFGDYPIDLLLPLIEFL